MFPPIFSYFLMIMRITDNRLVELVPSAAAYLRIIFRGWYHKKYSTPVRLWPILVSFIRTLHLFDVHLKHGHCFYLKRFVY